MNLRTEHDEKKILKQLSVKIQWCIVDGFCYAWNKTFYRKY